MNAHSLRLTVAFAAMLVPGAGLAQHEARQAGAGPASPDAAQCARVQPVVGNIIAAATARLESARQSNSPAEMRAAVDQLEAALRDIRTQLAPCAAAGAASEPPGGRTMPGMPQPSAAPAPAPMDHSKMPMGGGATAKPGAATGTKPTAPAAPMDHSKMKMPMSGATAGKPGAGTGTKPPPAAASTDHSKMPMGGEAKPGKVMDPVTGLMVDPATSPQTTYQGRTYYFSSEQSRKEFLESPAKFAKKPKG